MSTEILELDNTNRNTGLESPAEENLSSPEDPQMEETACDSCKTPECLIADYRFIRMLGEGTSGKTYLAERRADKKKVAVKELKVSSTYKSMELFERESAVLSHIDVPGVPKYYGYVKSPDVFGAAYLIQEYVPYPSLQKYLDDGKVFKESEVLGIMRKMADILDHLETDYSPAIIHRDIKPSNIMYDEETGDVSLIDFGAVANPQKKTMGSTVAGTMGFMAPEQLMGDCSIQSDYYALGATALYLLTGISPANMKHAADDPFKLEFETYLKRNVSKKMRQLLKSLLAVKSSDRPQNVSALKASLPAEDSDMVLSHSFGDCIKKAFAFIFFFVIPAMPIFNSMIIALSQVYDLSSLRYYDKMYAVGIGDPGYESAVLLLFMFFSFGCGLIPLPGNAQLNVAVKSIVLFVFSIALLLIMSFVHIPAYKIIILPVVYVIYICAHKLVCKMIENWSRKAYNSASEMYENNSNSVEKYGTRDKSESRFIYGNSYLYIEKLSSRNYDNNICECSYKNSRGRYSLIIVDRARVCEENGGLWFKDKGMMYKVIDDHNLL